MEDKRRREAMEEAARQEKILQDRAVEDSFVYDKNIIYIYIYLLACLVPLNGNYTLWLEWPN